MTPPGKPFPALLFWALLVPSVMFAGGAAMVMSHSSSELAVVLFVVPMAMEAVAVPIAIGFIVRGYRTRSNVILALAGSIPVLVFVGMWLVNTMSHVHF